MVQLGVTGVSAPYYEDVSSTPKDNVRETTHPSRDGNMTPRMVLEQFEEERRISCTGLGRR